MKTRTNQKKAKLSTAHAVLVRLGAAVLVLGALAVNAPSTLGCPCGSTQPSSVSDTCAGLSPSCYGSSCTRVQSERPLWCKYIDCGLCLTDDWWSIGGVTVWETIWDSQSNSCSETCVCSGTSRFVPVTVYETTRADPNCPPHS
jgi:hypothetical protein